MSLSPLPFRRPARQQTAFPFGIKKCESLIGGIGSSTRVHAIRWSPQWSTSLENPNRWRNRRKRWIWGGEEGWWQTSPWQTAANKRACIRGFPASGLYGGCLKDNFIYGGLASLSIRSIDGSLRACNFLSRGKKGDDSSRRGDEIIDYGVGIGEREGENVFLWFGHYNLSKITRDEVGAK